MEKKFLIIIIVVTYYLTDLHFLVVGMGGHNIQQLTEICIVKLSNVVYRMLSCAPSVLNETSMINV